MTQNMHAIIMGGILPALFFGVAGVFAKPRTISKRRTNLDKSLFRSGFMNGTASAILLVEPVYAREIQSHRKEQNEEAHRKE